MKKNRYYYGIDLFKLVCALLVVSIHSTMFFEYKELYHYFHSYVTRFAVPFFFISSGFFFSKILESKDSIKPGVKHYSIRLLRPFVIWGSFYFVVSLVEMILIDKVDIYIAIKYKLHLLLVESPGGGLWYVEALLWICFIVLISYKRYKSLTYYLIISGMLYLVQGLWNFEGLRFLSGLKNIYYTVFLSERTFIFYGVYFFVGIFIAFNLKRFIISPVKLCLLQAILYVFFIITNLKIDYIGIAVTNHIVKGFVAITWFLIAMNISNNSIPECWLKYNSRKLSTVIYFTHFTAIYFIEIMYKILHIQFDLNCTMACLICCFLLMSYSAVLCKSNRMKKIVAMLY